MVELRSSTGPWISWVSCVSPNTLPSVSHNARYRTPRLLRQTLNASYASPEVCVEEHRSHRYRRCRSLYRWRRNHPARRSAISSPSPSSALPEVSPRPLRALVALTAQVSDNKGAGMAPFLLLITPAVVSRHPQTFTLGRGVVVSHAPPVHQRETGS